MTTSSDTNAVTRPINLIGDQVIPFTLRITDDERDALIDESQRAERSINRYAIHMLKLLIERPFDSERSDAIKEHDRTHPGNKSNYFSLRLPVDLHTETKAISTKIKVPFNTILRFALFGKESV